MNPISYQLKQISALLSTIKVDYAVIGGIAVSVYSEPRLTMDIDVSILLDAGRLGLFLASAKRYGFTPIPPNIKKFVKTTGVIPMAFSKDKVKGKCDFIIAQNALEYQTIKRARSKKLYSIGVKLVRAEDLLIHKAVSERPRDLEDARGIIIKQGAKLDMKYISYWLKKIAESNHKPQLYTTFKNLVKSAKI